MKELKPIHHEAEYELALAEASCSRRPNIDPGCRLNIDPGPVAVF